MRYVRICFVLGILTSLFTYTVVGQGSPRTPSAQAPLQRAPDIGPGSPSFLPGTGNEARTFITQAQSFISQGKAVEAKEALQTAIRLEPMNPEAWRLYDYAVELKYLDRARDEKRNPVVERDLKPLFAIERVESYDEFGSLILVGEVRNLSDSLRQNVELRGILLDENKQELRRESAYLPLKDRGLFPNESSLFEIPFKNPPPGVKSFQVRVAGFD
jgi:hypothetical protein